ncbi:MAG: RluA family pseudouridine synthase [Clostridia bacterium]|nr:RluA family pseudouridine synthase [Clostridia bacterium]
MRAQIRSCSSSLGKISIQDVWQLYRKRGIPMQMIVPEDKDGMMLVQLLSQTAADIPLWAIKEAIKKRDVRIDGVRTGSDVRVYAGQEIRAFWPKNAVSMQKKELHPPEIVFEDEHILLINKPQGIASQNEDHPLEGDTALTRVLRYIKQTGGDAEHLHLCHRLDVQTGGLLLFAKDDAAFESAMQAFSLRTFQKFYTCRVKGCPAQHEAVMHAHLRKDAQISRVSVTDYPARGSVEIVTAYRVAEAGEYARLEVELITGRTHQIRAHLAHIGHPILGDDKYGDRALNRMLGIKRQQLWATRLIVSAEGALAYLNGREFSVQCPF